MVVKSVQVEQKPFQSLPQTRHHLVVAGALDVSEELLAAQLKNWLHLNSLVGGGERGRKKKERRDGEEGRGKNRK